MEPLKLQHLNFKGQRLKMVGFIIGITFVILGGLMLPTIILTIPGFFGIMIGLGIAAACAPTTLVNCGHCGAEIEIKKSDKAVDCLVCKKVTPIKWFWRNPNRKRRRK